MCGALLRVCYIPCVMNRAHCRASHLLACEAAMQAVVSEPPRSLCLSVICSRRPAERSGQYSAWEVRALAGQLQGREGPKHWLIFDKLQAMNQAVSEGQKVGPVLVSAMYAKLCIPAIDLVRC